MLTGRTRPPHDYTGGESINGPDDGARRTGHMCAECRSPMVSDGVDEWCSGCGILSER
ncbi:hypothetical protein [Halococcus saccharolyticus]|uniref:hypothetical protein n=1 Tax=Halococcus saccharolyticus TaxID=62319 RepID=UPI000A6EC02C|nr:hypothetical protein [Halococcus saccharolyticus]